MTGVIFMKFGMSDLQVKQFWAIEAIFKIRPTGRVIGVARVWPGAGGGGKK